MVNTYFVIINYFNFLGKRSKYFFELNSISLVSIVLFDKSWEIYFFIPNLASIVEEVNSNDAKQN